MRLINADELTALYGDDDALRVSVAVVKQNIADMPTIEAEPKHGRWIKRGENLYECSECGAWVVPSKYMPLGWHKFCRGCGAKMGEVTE